MNIDILGTASVKPIYNPQTSSLQLVLVGDLKSTTVAVLNRDVFTVLKHEYMVLLKVDIVELDISSAGIVDSLGMNLVLTVLNWANHNNAEASIIIGSRGVYDTMSAIGLDRHAKLVYRE